MIVSQGASLEEMIAEAKREDAELEAAAAKQRAEVQPCNPGALNSVAHAHRLVF